MIDYYQYVWHATSFPGMLSSPLGNRRPNCPSAQLPLAEIRRSDDKVFQDFVVGIFKGNQNSHFLRGGAFSTQRWRDWSYTCEFSTWDLKLEGLCLAVCYHFKKLKPVFASLEFQKQGHTFVIRLYLGTETVSCWLWMARMDMHWNLTKLSQHFQVLTYGMPSKITKQNVVVSAPWWNLFDIFVITLQGHFCVWVKRSWYVSGKLPTNPSPKPSFCLKWEVSFNAGLGEG